MDVVTFSIDGILMFVPKVFTDSRGYFEETYHFGNYEEYLPKGTVFVQDNLSYSGFGVIRGLHYQQAPYPQAKLVRCVLGKILDVAVDIRTGSPTFGKHISIELSSDNCKQLFIPKGFAHGFSVIGREAIVEYKCDEYYYPKSDAGIRWDDNELDIQWKIDSRIAIVSEKDRDLPFLKDLSTGV